MPTPTVEDRPPDPAVRMHLRLAERGSAILPEAGNAEGRVTLTDAMLVVAALAACFALFRESMMAGVAALVVTFPALARTHVVMIRDRAIGRSPTAFDWMIAFVSSTIRVGLVLGLVSVIHAASLVLGWSVGARLAPAPLPARAPGVPATTALLGMSPAIGTVLGVLLIGIPLTLVTLAYLYPRLLSVRDPGSR